MIYNYLVIEGNIGAGKTTLSRLMARQLNSNIVLEEFAENTFLPRFYKDPEKYAFSLELSFLADRYHQLRELDTDDRVIADYYIMKSYIFAKANLDEDEFALFDRMYNIILDKLPKPELMIFLDSSIDRLRLNIKKRGRPYERDIQEDYLLKIDSEYQKFIENLSDWPVLVFDTAKYDFVNEPKDYAFLMETLKKEYPKGATYFGFDE